ncbi:glycoside hydrolase family 47 protein [Calditrichota bacterium LG25]
MKSYVFSGVYFLSLACLLLCMQSCNPDQKPAAAPEHYLADSVKAEFLHAWRGYWQYARGMDDLKPVSQKGRNWYEESLLMTPVDAYDTMILLGLEEEKQQARELIYTHLNFDKNFSVKAFEINIRLLGGLLSAYQLEGDSCFLRLATDLADRLLPVFDSPTGMPYMFVNLATGETSGEISNPAEIGTYIVEFGTLSRITKNKLYVEKAKRAMQALYQRRSSIGLVGTSINVETGAWIDRSSHLGGMIDSYYEYLLKGAILLDDTELWQMWKTSVAAVNRYLKQETNHSLWYGRSDMESGKIHRTWFGALEAFFPAVLALDKQLNFADCLWQSYFEVWRHFGLAPEMFDYQKREVVSAFYFLRPELIESTYYLYYFTRDEKYRQAGSAIFASLKKHCKTKAGYAALKNVITKEKSDSMESFFLAETLKYLYLLFKHPDFLDLDKIIFNTEAHLMMKVMD